MTEIVCPSVVSNCFVLILFFYIKNRHFKTFETFSLIIVKYKKKTYSVAKCKTSLVQHPKWTIERQPLCSILIDAMHAQVQSHY